MTKSCKESACLPACLFLLQTDSETLHAPSLHHSERLFCNIWINYNLLCVLLLFMMVFFKIQYPYRHWYLIFYHLPLCKLFPICFFPLPTLLQLQLQWISSSWDHWRRFLSYHVLSYLFLFCVNRSLQSDSSSHSTLTDKKQTIKLCAHFGAAHLRLQPLLNKAKTAKTQAVCCVSPSPGAASVPPPPLLYQNGEPGKGTF